MTYLVKLFFYPNGQRPVFVAILKAIESASDNLRDEISPRLGEYSTKLMEIMTAKIVVPCNSIMIDSPSEVPIGLYRL